jgi:RNA polymerase sigma factor
MEADSTEQNSADSREQLPTQNALLEELKLAKTDNQALDVIVHKYLPFIKKAVHRAFFHRQDRQDNLPEAMLAFAPAVQTYSPDRGAFIPYAGTIIRNRLIDIARQEVRIKNGLLSFSLQSGGDDIQVEADASQQLYERVQEEKNLHSEVETVKAEFSEWGFSVEDLVAKGPKQARLRAECLRVVHTILENQELLTDMFRTHQLPIKRLCESVIAAKFRRKTIDRYRQYIIALVIISKGGYPFIYSCVPQDFDEEETTTIIQRGESV